MAVEVVLASEVERDLAEAYDWYEDRRAGLGDEFLSCVEAQLQAISRMPEMHAVVYREYRQALVRRFPYSLFYEVSENVVTVYAVFHTARDPDKWKKRLP